MSLSTSANRPGDGSALLARHRRKFGLAPGLRLDEAMVQEHWTLERRLADELRACPREGRWAAFERAYTTLYQRCPWLNESEAGDGAEADDALDFGHIARLLGGPPGARLDVYEVGAGQGRLARHLARLGHRCRATEITSARGAGRRDGVDWRVSDGVNLAAFEPLEAYDAVVSTHVIEHLHPDDLPAHLANALAILRPGGRYVVATPHAHAGPTDLSEVFGLDQPVCMHLHELTWGELESALRTAGFARVEAAYVAPRRLRRLAPVRFRGAAYLAYLRAVERVLARIRRPARRRAAWFARVVLFRPEILIVAHKGRRPARPNPSAI